MTDKKVSALTDGTTANDTDRIPVARSPFGSGDNAYITPAYLDTYMASTTKTLSNKTLTAPTLTGAVTLTGGTLNGTVLDISAALTGTGTYTGIKFNWSSDSGPSNAASLLLDLQVGGSSKFNVRRDGRAQFGLGSAASPAITSATGNSGIYFANGGDDIALSYATSQYAQFTLNQIRMGSTGAFSWSSSASGSSAADLFLTRAAAATLQHGAADAASPVAQTIGFQNVVAGTSNTAGANATIRGSAGTGTGVGGSLIFQVAPAGSSGTAQNAWATALTINSAQQIIAASNGTVSAPAFVFGGRGTGTNWGIYSDGASSISNAIGGTQTQIFWSDGSLYLKGTSPELRIGTNTGWLSWGTSADVTLYRDAANTLALRNSTNAQTFRVYKEADAGLTNTSFGYMEAGVTANTLILGSNKVGSPSVALTKLQINVDGTNKLDYAVSTAGTWTFSGAIISNGNLQIGSGSYLGFNGRALIASAANDRLTLTNPAANGFDRLSFGTETASFPSLKRVSANLQVIAADGTSSAGFIVGNQAISTSATDGFLYIPTCAGTPSGTPTTQTGTAPLVVDSTNNKLYVYVGGAWTAMN